MEPMSTRSSRLLIASLAADGLIMMFLGLWDVYLAVGGLSFVGAALWLTASGINCAAAIVCIKRGTTWLSLSVIGQSLVVLFALYVFLTDIRSPVNQFHTVAGVAIVLGIVAMVWVVRLAPAVVGFHRRVWGTILALIPLLGLFQFWMETDYLPRTALPAVDVEMKLAETGRSGEIVHAEVAISLHNRGNLTVDIVGSVLRVTAYSARFPGTEISHSLAGGLDFDYSEDEFRVPPVDDSAAQTVYADDFAGTDTVLAPGATFPIQRVVDLDLRQWSRLRASAQISFTNSRVTEAVHTCFEPRVDSFDPEFRDAAGKVQRSDSGIDFFCRETAMAARNVTQALVGDRQSVRTYIVLRDKNKPPGEVPFLLTSAGLTDSFEESLQSSRALKALGREWQLVTWEVITEFAPGDPPPK
ncbi:hypothetical protein G3I13_19300 [Streptomyces sp. SID6673]|nr:hypothetical protein [Streptomyces sp. SID11726]NEB26484.1 hypothetical protein [Streptomyces sp. SID6673]